mmetsp:Transcript_22942/g.65613  ORF Transcript_22942/g.65613 Transcript_22942/m.65613 type:complete len:233 (-) Transcript_22942:369-1067(-)
MRRSSVAMSQPHLSPCTLGVSPPSLSLKERGCSSMLAKLAWPAGGPDSPSKPPSELTLAAATECANGKTTAAAETSCERSSRSAKVERAPPRRSVAPKGEGAAVAPSASVSAAAGLGASLGSLAVRQSAAEKGCRCQPPSGSSASPAASIHPPGSAGGRMAALRPSHRMWRRDAASGELSAPAVSAERSPVRNRMRRSERRGEALDVPPPARGGGAAAGGGGGSMRRFCAAE